MLETAPSHPRPRYTTDGDASLEAHLDAVCARVRDGVTRIISERELHGILLGGGYGRGEGGVLRTPDGDLPYNDLEFYVFVRGSALPAERRHGAALRELGHALEEFAGIEVEFKLVNRRGLQRSGTTMFFHDLVSGHRVVAGSSDLLAGCAHHTDGSTIPLHEATRLLMNRCSGLLFAAERLQREEFTGEDADFVGRNIAKAQLALGDAVLVVHGLYHSSARVRGTRLSALPAPRELPDFASVVHLHGEGVAFKLRPARSAESREVLTVRHAVISTLAREVFLWLESRRLGAGFSSPRAYAESGCDKCPETPMWRNTLVNARWQGFRAFANSPLRHPRQRLLHALALLLWEPAVFADAKISDRLASQLLKPAPDLASAVATYTPLWHRFQ